MVTQTDKRSHIKAIHRRIKTNHWRPFNCLKKKNSKSKKPFKTLSTCTALKCSEAIWNMAKNCLPYFCVGSVGKFKSFIFDSLFRILLVKKWLQKNSCKFQWKDLDVVQKIWAVRQVICIYFESGILIESHLNEFHWIHIFKYFTTSMWISFYRINIRLCCTFLQILSLLCIC